MAEFLKTLIRVLSFITLLLTMANARSSPSADRKTSFSYDFTKVKPSDLTYQADAFFPSDSAVLRLTKTDHFGYPEQSSMGRALYTNPILFSDKNKKADFESTLKFIINPYRGDDNPADGLVFFIAPVGSVPNIAGGSFGVFDYYGKNPSVFAVEFDIYHNTEYSEYQDPEYRHVGIDIGNSYSKNVTDFGDGILGQEVTAVISYSAASKLICVKGGSASKSFEVSYVFDLSSLLPSQVQVGISAATGGAVAVFDVMSWSFSSELVHVKA